MAVDVPSEDLVSVVLPTYNRARTLPRAIHSVLQQSYRNLELLVVDDASTDETAAVVKAISDPRLRYIPLTENGGASRARNTGMREAKGDFIAFQDSDDEWLAGKLEKQVQAAKSVSDTAVTVFHPKIICGRDDQARYGPFRVCCLPAIEDANPDFIQLIHRVNPISPQALMISRETFNRAGFFDEDLVNNEDWMYGIELFYKSTVVFLRDPLVINYLQNDSISRLMRPGARAQLRVIQRLRKLPDVRRDVIGSHLGRVAWSIAKLGYPRFARRLLLKAVKISPRDWKNWARLTVTVARLTLNRPSGRSRIAPR